MNAGAPKSPLRYPGSKRRLVPVLAALLRANGASVPLLVEPFCGGASVGLGLLATGIVDRVLLNDADPLVSSFWSTAAAEPEWLIDAMRAEPVTVERWEHHRRRAPLTTRDRALTCLFLNRTTFSGILHHKAGPIGGKAQTSAYRIDCRFNKDDLAARIRAVGALADSGRLEVAGLDYAELLAGLARRRTLSEQTVVYCDPPYVDKARHLYEMSFGPSDHARLAAVLAGLPWRFVLSYDDAPEIRALYLGASSRSRGLLVPLRYFARAESDQRRVSEELVVTDLPVVPADSRWTVLEDSPTSLVDA